MSDANQGKRPLSPHLEIYRPQITSVLSILHRITGVGMALALVLIVWWFLAAATSDAYFAMVDGVLTSWFGILILAGSLLAFWFHFFNGIRHLKWDAGLAMSKIQVRNSGKIAVAAALVATIASLIYAF